MTVRPGGSSPSSARARQAFGELFRRHYAGVVAYATRFTGGDTATAEDLTQQAFLNVLLNALVIEIASRHRGETVDAISRINRILREQTNLVVDDR